ncbi:MAG TPA: hypothetical protein VKM94_06970 [Blastocatellia bacterium]|nr:hypothetical protein [Blastocatellia bacterium]
MVASADFKSELQRLDEELAEVRDRAMAAPPDGEVVIRFAHRLYQRGSLTGDLQELERAERVLDGAIDQGIAGPDVWFLKASLAFNLHRISDARMALAADSNLAGSVQARALMADLDFEEGKYKEAQLGYEHVVEQDRSWDNLARLAHAEAKLGDDAAAEKLFVEAEEELTAKQMRAFAWVELQRGLLHLSRGRHEYARVHYERADRAYPGYWLVCEHIAELTGAEGGYADAATMYEEIVETVPRPEFQQALGELLLLMGESEKAEWFFVKAVTAYLESARRGCVHYYHHLADFFADVREDGEEAVKWARRDLGLRENFSTQAALAWALYRDGRFEEAWASISKSIASGVKDARIFSRAASILLALDKRDEGDKYLEMAVALNPRFQSFHVHR